MAADKVKHENLKPSDRSPTIPIVYDPTPERKAKTKRKDTESVPKATETPPPETKKEVEDQSVASIREPTADKRTKPKKPGAEIPASKEITFSIEAFVNEYGFLKVQKKVLEKIGWYQKIDARRSKKVDVTLDFENGALIIKKKA